MKILDFTEKEKVVVIGAAKQINHFNNTIKNILYSLPKYSEEEMLMAEKVLKVKKTKKKEKQRFPYNNTIFICFGNSLLFSNFEKHYNLLKEVNNGLIKGNSFILFLRGNNDNPTFFENDFFADKELSNFKTISDYTVIKTSKHNILCAGGAISVDRQWKKNREAIINKYETNVENHKHLYFPNEGFVFNDDIKNDIENTIANGLVFDTIITQATPNIEKYNYPFYLFDNWKDGDENLIKDIDNEKSLLKSLFETVNKTNNIICWATSNYGSDSVMRNGDIIYFSPCSGRIEELDQMIEIKENKLEYSINSLFTSFKKKPLGTVSTTFDPLAYFGSIDATMDRPQPIAEEVGLEEPIRETVDLAEEVHGLLDDDVFDEMLDNIEDEATQVANHVEGNGTPIGIEQVGAVYRGVANVGYNPF